MSAESVSSAAWAAVRDEEERRRRERDAQQLKEMKAEKVRFNRLVRKHHHLLTDSILPNLFPDTKWHVTRVSEVWKGPNGSLNLPTLWVRDAKDSPSFATEFRINEHGVYIDYNDERSVYGPPYWESVPATVEIKSVLDVGRVLKRKSDIMDASYRRNPD